MLDLGGVPRPRPLRSLTARAEAASMAGLEFHPAGLELKLRPTAGPSLLRPTAGLELPR